MELKILLCQQDYNMYLPASELKCCYTWLCLQQQTFTACVEYHEHFIHAHI